MNIILPALVKAGKTVGGALTASGEGSARDRLLDTHVSPERKPHNHSTRLTQGFMTIGTVCKSSKYGSARVFCVSESDAQTVTLI